MADQPLSNPEPRPAESLLQLARSTDAGRRSRTAQPTEPPYTDPYVRWCGRGGAVTLPPIPIGVRDPSLGDRPPRYGRLRQLRGPLSVARLGSRRRAGGRFSTVTAARDSTTRAQVVVGGNGRTSRHPLRTARRGDAVPVLTGETTPETAPGTHNNGPGNRPDPVRAAPHRPGSGPYHHPGK